MKQFLSLFILLCLGMGSFAADNNPGEEKSFISLMTTVKGGTALSIYQTFFCANVEVDLLFGDWVGAGLETGLNYGLTYKDLYETTFLALKLGWLYLGPGFAWKMADATLPAGSKFETFARPAKPVNFALTAGLLVPVFKLGPGRLGFNFSVDWYIPDIPIVYGSTEGLNFLEIIVRNIALGIGQTVIGVIFSGKPALEATYSL